MLKFFNIFALEFTNVNTMATGYGLSGKVRGKIGSKVYRIESGKQIISEYNPEKTGVVSDTQIQQRAKMALAVEVSKCFAPSLIVGLSRNRADARRLFRGGIIRNAAVTPVSGGQATAHIEANQIVISDGSLMNVVSKSFTYSASRNTILTATIKFVERYDIDKFMLVVLPKRVITGEWLSAVSVLSNIRGLDGSFTASITYSSDTEMSDLRFFGYAVPIMPNQLGKRIDYSQVLEMESEGVFRITAMEYLTRQANLGKSIYLGETGAD